MSHASSFLVSLRLPQDILDATIRHSPGMAASTPLVSNAVRGATPAGTSTLSQALLVKEPSVVSAGGDRDPGRGEGLGSAERKRDAESQGDEVVIVGVEGGREGGRPSDAVAAAAASEAAIAAAAEEVASAESHSLTQGAMKLVYLLAIQVGIMRASASSCGKAVVSMCFNRGRGCDLWDLRRSTLSRALQGGGCCPHCPTRRS